MKKQKNSAAMKRQAFMSFLETSGQNKQSQAKKNNSDQEEVYQEEYTEGSNCCNVCGIEVADNVKNKKLCGFCDLVACKDHLRKRRRKKNKWEKICDCCEDKFVYDSYMRLEKKKEQSLLVEEEIVTMKHDNITEIYGNKKSKIDKLLAQEQSIKQAHQQQLQKIQQAQNQLQGQRKSLDMQENSCSQIEQDIGRIQKKIKDNYQEDYRLLQKQNEKLIKQLSTVEKKCYEVRTALKKREKEIELAYEEWEEKQRQKRLQQKKKQQKSQDCVIF